MFRNALFLAWIALLGTTRIDLLGGAMSFTLPPLYLLTAAVAVSEWSRRLAASHVTAAWTRPHASYAALVLALLALVVASVVRSPTLGLSLSRALLLTCIAVGVSLALWGAADRDDLGALLARGARWGLGIGAAFSAAQLAQFLGLVPDILHIGPATVGLESLTYGIFPRLTAYSAGSNTAAPSLLLFAVLIGLDGRARGTDTRGFPFAWMALAGLLILLTLSRTGLLAAGTAALLLPRLTATSPAVAARHRRALHLAAAPALLAVALGSAALLHGPTREAVARDLAPLAHRLDPRESSAETHAHLYARGIHEATASVPRTLLGAGYGSSHRLLMDLFPGDTHGNFHTLYLQLWVEAGVGALLLFLALLLLTVPRAGALASVVAAFALFNVFQEGLAEPALWLVLALAWLAPGVAGQRSLRPWWIAEATVPEASA